MPAHALIVEDEPHIRELLELHLRLEGLQVSSCEDGEAALQAVGTTTYDLVVLDVM
jgi:two-component system OmpR family response regulator